MSLQDEHLKQALKLAPDHDMAPSNAVRKKVLNYAQDAAQAKQEGWLKRWFNVLSNWQVKSWQLVGMSSAASIFLVMVMVRPQLPDELIWISSDEQDIALTEEVEPAVVSADQQEKPAPLRKEEVSSSLADAALPENLGENEVSQLGNNPSPKAKKVPRTERKVVKKLVEKIEKPTVVLSGNNNAGAVAPAKGSVDKIAAAEADAVGESVLEDKAMPAGAREKMRDLDMADEPSITARSKAASVRQSVSGIALANKDIQSGNLRILLAGDAWPVDKPLVDGETGFRIELTRMSESETAAYNQVIRDWYRESQSLNN